MKSRRRIFLWKKLWKQVNALIGKKTIDGKFEGYIKNIPLILSSAKDIIKIESKQSTFSKNTIQIEVEKYFSLDINYEEMLKRINTDKYIQKAIKEYKGLRLIKQSHLIGFTSFMLSSNNNVKRISGSVQAIEQKSLKEYGVYTNIDILKKFNDEDFKSVGAGYRSAFLTKAFEKLSNEFLESLENVSYIGARESLMGFSGIGEKVADCILLYSYKFDDIYPLDVWIKRITDVLYISTKTNKSNKIFEFASKHFNGLSGWAQLFLYAYAREVGIDKLSE